MAIKRKAKFRVDQVVMVRNLFGSYPVKLAKCVEETQGKALGIAWWDTLHNIEYEKEMRPLTARERRKKE